MGDNLILEGLLSMVTELKEKLEAQVTPASREETLEPRTEENGYLLKPGQTLNVNTDTYQAELIEYNQPTDVLLWINGKLEFKQQSLLEITNIMEKLYDIKFIYKDEALKSERFTGEFSTDSTADEILNVLMHTNHFSYKKDGRIVRVMKK